MSASARGITLTLLLALGCDRGAEGDAAKPSPEVPPSASATPDEPAPPSGPAPAADADAPPPAEPASAAPTDPSAPALAGELGESGLEPAAEAPDSPALAWAFAPGKTWVYAYEQQLEVESPSLAMPSNTFNGSLRVEATSETAADVRIEIDAASSAGAPTGPLPPYKDLLRPSGGLDRAPDPVVAAMLTPPQTLPALGETVVEAINMPVNLVDEKHALPGTRSSTLRGWVECGASVCAELDTTVRVERQTATHELMTTTVEVHGVGRLIFDLDGSLYWHRSATRISMSTARTVSDQPYETSMVQQHLHDIRRRD